MNIRALKYALPLMLYVLAMISFSSHGIYCWLLLLFGWVLIPLMELLMKKDIRNLSQAEEEMAKKDKVYDLLLYLSVVLLYPTLFIFLHSMQEPGLALSDRIARVATMGMLCGTIGINVGHELGHRSNRFEQMLGKASLLISLYTHFFIEHNKGHHKNVATRKDPSSARLGESVYHFYPRTIILTYISAWRIAGQDAQKNNRRVFGLQNETLQLQFVQLVFILLIFFVFGWKLLLYYLAAAFMGALLLETVNYIEHYGLSRKKMADGKFERALPRHSWNSDHPIGRLLLFELSRHSDHHYLASRKYQLLRHHEDAPELPTGYPGMMLLSLFPPIWFFVMNRQMEKYKSLLSEPPVKLKV
ncbi:MAG: alkane 1-monooxygenase [Bacteroidetes bacterium]|nr:alkane 1-monooxygenase [Bacteroidota bacterium]